MSRAPFPAGAALACALLGAVPGGAAAQTAKDGHAIAVQDCSGCHAVEAAQPQRRSAAPAFPAIARMDSTTELSLSVFLRTSHAPMPNIMLTPDETRAVARYIVSLKPGGG